MKRKRLLAAVMAAVMASTLTMGMPVTGYAMDQGTETVASEPEGSNSSDVAATNPELDAESVAEESASTDEFAGASESQETEPDTASAAENTEAEGGAVAAPDAQNNTVGTAEENGAASAGTVGAAETKTFGNFEYKVKDDGTVSITKYTGSDANVTIPTTIDGKTVSEIGTYDVNTPIGVDARGAFYNCTSLQQITIPDSVTSIGEAAHRKVCFLRMHITSADHNSGQRDQHRRGCFWILQSPSADHAPEQRDQHKRGHFCRVHIASADHAPEQRDQHRN